MTLPSDPEQLYQHATAFVFGELSDEQTAAFRKHVESSAELQQLVTEIRDTVGALEKEFTIASPPMQGKARDTVQQAMQASGDAGQHEVVPPPVVGAASKSEPDALGSWRAALIGFVVAASVLLLGLLALPGLMSKRPEADPQLAMQIQELETQNVRLEQENSSLQRRVSELSHGEDKAAGRETSAPTEDAVRDASPSTQQQQNSADAVDPFAAMEGKSGQSDPAGQSGQGEQKNGQASGQQNQGGEQSDGGQKGQEQAGSESRSSNSNSNSNSNSQSGAAGQGALPSQAAGDQRSNGQQGQQQQQQQQQGKSSDRRHMEIVAAPMLMDSSGSTPMPKSSDLSVLESEAKIPPRKRRGGNALRRNTEGMEMMEMEISEEMMMDEMTDDFMGDDMGMGGAVLGGQGFGGAAMGPAIVARDGRFGRNANELDVAPRVMGDRFAAVADNPFQRVLQKPLSTFSIDVDTASYSKMRMYLTQHSRIPQPNSIRIEELVNYFDYSYPAPEDGKPFSAAMQIASCPWNPKHRLARIGIKGKVIEGDRPSSNLVFLLDVSGSMSSRNKLPLVIDGMKRLVTQLSENDSVAIVVYAGAAGLVLDATPGSRKKTIVGALDRLKAGGSTAGAQGIKLAYHVARENFIPGGTNRVILCTDGDFNVGVSNTDGLVALAKDNAKSNIFLSVLGYGSGNHNDAMMEAVSNQANGNYAFIDTEGESRKVLVEQMQATLVTIAKDVKIQVEFNPSEVASYRLIGYANRLLAAKDFNDDTKDAGEIGAGHTVTALYEIVPAEKKKADKPKTAAEEGVDPLRYQLQDQLSDLASSGEMLTLKMRYKEPEGKKSKLIQFPVKDSGKSYSEADEDFQFAAAVASFGMLLRHSTHRGDTNLDAIEELALAAAQGDKTGYRREFVMLVKQAKRLLGK